MSLEEDSELRDLVVKSLESNGILAKLKAQLRASIFITLEEENSIKEKIPYNNNKLKGFLEHKHGKLLFSLIKDILEFFDLDYTKSVFEAEACLNDFVTPIDHSEIFKEFNTETINDTEPLLYNLLFRKNIHQKLNDDVIEIKLNEQISTETESITPKPITQIRTSIKNINNKTFTKLDNVTITPEISRESSVISENTLEKSSIVEDYSSIEQNLNTNDNFLIDFDKSVKLSSNIDNNIERGVQDDIPLNLLDDTISKVICSSPVLLEKSEKVKTFSSLSSLQDLPPLNINNINKNRNEPILLPSLYTRDVSDNRKERKYSSDSQSCDESIDIENTKSHSS